MLPDCPKPQFVVDVVKQTFDVKLQTPIISKAKLARDPYGIQGRFSRPVAIGMATAFTGGGK